MLHLDLVSIPIMRQMYLFDLTLFYVLPTELFKLIFQPFQLLLILSLNIKKNIFILILIFYSQISGGIIPPEGRNVVKSI